MHQAPTLVRQWLTLLSLQSSRYGLTIRQMAEQAGVAQRTVRRDLQMLQRLGFAVEEGVSTRGRKHWRIDESQTPPMLSFTWEEAFALYVGRQFLEPLAGTMFWQGTHSAFQKIRAHFADPALQYVDQMASSVHQTLSGVSDYSRHDVILDALMVGIEDRRFTSLTYQSLRATEPVTYDVYPYGLVFHRWSLYLVAFAPDHDMIRHYKVDRIEHAEAQRLRFQKPADFDLEAYLSDTFGVYKANGKPARIEVRFHPAVARTVQESRWHSSQILTLQPDGSVIAQFCLTDTTELKSWLLSFGPNATVLKPKQLRTEIAADIAAMQALYAQPTTHKAH